MLETVLSAAVLYAIGWSVTAKWFAGILGPVPLPGRRQRDRRDALLWPIWLLLYAFIWLMERRRQSFERELSEDW